jgi:hypothetical protein
VATLPHTAAAPPSPRSGPRPGRSFRRSGLALPLGVIDTPPSNLITESVTPYSIERTVCRENPSMTRVPSKNRKGDNSLFVVEKGITFRLYATVWRPE